MLVVYLQERCRQGLGGKGRWKETTWKTRRRWEDNIKMHLQEVKWRGVDWMALGQENDRWRALVNAVMNLQVPLNSWNFLTRSRPVSFSIGVCSMGVYLNWRSYGGVNGAAAPHGRVPRGGKMNVFEI
jgi:hypothetical protein